MDCASPTSSFCSPEAVLAALLTLFWEPLPEFVEVPLLAATSAAPETRSQLAPQLRVHACCCDPCQSVPGKLLLVLPAPYVRIGGTRRMHDTTRNAGPTC